jgi:ribonuclease J
MASTEVRWIPLGGLGEIGMNCFALEQGDEVLIVDCGVAFSDDGLGGDLIHPDFSWLVENQHRLVGLVITHGHEDHIGGVPSLLRELSVELPIYAPAHARALLLDRFQEAVGPAPNIVLISPREAFSVGSFVCEGYAMAHSIIDALGLCILTEAGTIFHTGDFDLDLEQPAGRETDLSGLSELGETGVRLLLSDSTNIERTRRTQSEGDVARRLEELVKAAEGRVIVGLFSSNVHRLLALGEIAQKTGRKLCFMGKSLERHVRVALSLGRLKFPSDLLVDARQLSELPRGKVLLIAGGCQGEGASALRRLSLGVLVELQIEAGDLLIMSSRAIPGNEKRVFTMLNDFARLGVHSVTSREDAWVHTSGHASREELAIMIRTLQPQGFVPVHGTLLHLRKHAELAREQGVEDCLVVENGASIVISADRPLRLGPSVQVGLTRLSQGGLRLTGPLRRSRGELAREGVVLVSATWGQDREARVLCSCVGVVGLDREESVLVRLKAAVQKILSMSGSGSTTFLESEIRRGVRKFVGKISGERPKVEIHLHRSP